MNEIRFYRAHDDYGFLSNFAAYPFELDGKRWPTSEHYFQAMKFLSPETQSLIRSLDTPGRAAKVGRREKPLRNDWESVKDQFMFDAVLAKFTQNPDIARKLLDTGDAYLIEHTKNDSYWADGGDGSGENRLGEVLMAVRDSLRAQQNP